MAKLPFTVRATDMIHRTAVLSLFGITVIGTGSILFNIYANSDFARMNQNKLRFNKQDYEQARATEENKE